MGVHAVCQKLRFMGRRLSSCLKRRSRFSLIVSRHRSFWSISRSCHRQCAERVPHARDCCNTDAHAVAFAIVSQHGRRGRPRQSTRPAERSASAISTSAPSASGSRGRAHRCVLEDAARDEAMLERNRSFHVRAAVIDVARHRQQPVMDGARAFA